MSDRTQGSVRTDSRDGDDSSAAGVPSAAPASATQSIPTTGAQRAQAPGSSDVERVNGTQSIPTTGTQRAQAPGTGAVPVVPQPLADAPASAAAPAPGGAHAAPDQNAPAAGAGPVTGATATAPTTAGAAGTASRTSARPSGRGPRRARLQLRHIDTWSALKISLVLSISLFFVWMVAVGLLYLVLNGLGVFDTINGLVGQLGSATGSDDGGEVLTPGVVFGAAAIVGAINVVLLTALCTVGTFMYNLCSDLVGGLEVTLSERD
jgi:hypothetical protein